MFQFPSNPTIGQTYTPSPGLTFRWNGQAWYLTNTNTLTEGEANELYLQLIGGTMIGNITLPDTGSGAQASTVNQVNTSMNNHLAASDPHPQYLTESEGDSRYALKGQGGGGVYIHGELEGLSADDHQQYYNESRGDARYLQLSGGAMTGQIVLPGGGAGSDAATYDQAAQLASDEASSAVAAHVSDVNPHTQYLTEAEADGIYLSLSGGSMAGQIVLLGGGTGNEAATVNETLSAASDAVNNHVAQPDPHTQYLLSTDASATYIPLIQKGEANGVAPLNGSAQISAQYLAFTTLTYVGGWDASGNTLPPSPPPGGIYNITVQGTLNVVPPGSTTPTPTLCEVGNYIIYSQAQDLWYYATASSAINDARYVQLTGSTMTGELVLPGGGSGNDAATITDATGIATTQANTAINDHVAQPDPHTQYLLETAASAGYLALVGGTMTGNITLPGTGTLNQAATVTQATNAANTAVSNHVAAADPHTQYYNQTRGDARYLQLTGGTLSGQLSLPGGGSNLNAATINDATNISNSAITTHVGQTDPHTQYLLETDATNTYIPLSQKAAANGVATLGAGVTIPTAQIPNLSATYIPQTSANALLWQNSAKFVSASAPTTGDGNDGDLWFEYE